MRFEAVRAAAPHRQDMLQIGQIGAHAVQHRFVVEAAEHLRYDHELAAAMCQHKGKFALAENVHQRIDHCADARTREVGQR